MTDWEARARELLNATLPPREDWGEEGVLTPEEAMLQLAREAADARAEEIAQACKIEGERGYGADESCTYLRALEEGAKIARSFISKKDEPKTNAKTMCDVLQTAVNRSLADEGWPELRVKVSPREKKLEPESKDPFLREQQLLQKARDEAYGRGWREGLEAGKVSAPCIVPPKTREQMLEKALREIAPTLAELERMARENKNYEAAAAYAGARMDLELLIRRALEWKPTGKCQCDPPPEIVWDTNPQRCPKCELEIK